MAYELHKNAIITGNVHSFCLACDSLLKTKQDAYSHITSSKHSEKLSLAPYFHEYKDHYIRKLKAGYFCAFCNTLLPTLMKLNLHLTQENHQRNRGNILLKSVDNKIIAFDTVVIKDSAWHGLKDNVCSLCDTEYENENHHKNETSHVLNLIQKTIQFGTNDAVYRHVDESTIQCLTCDLILSRITMNTHFSAPDHLDIYAKCKTTETNTAVDANNSFKDPQDEQSVQSVEKGVQNLSIDIESHIETSNEPMNNNGITRTEFPNYNSNRHTETKILKNMNPDVTQSDSNNDFASIDMLSANEYSDASDSLTLNTIENIHIPLRTEKSIAILDTEFKNDEQTEPLSVSNNKFKKSLKTQHKHTVLSAEAIKLAKDNEITYNPHNADAFCRICQVRVPSSFNCMEEHIKGNGHNKNRAKAQKTTLRKIKTNVFIRRLDSLEKPFNCTVVIINREYLLSDLSFYLMIKTDNVCELKCLLCETYLSYVLLGYKATVDLHYLWQHSKYFKNIPVIASLPSEFIREIHLGKYHCGYCNVVVMSWSDMETHFESSNHKQRKIINSLRLNEIRSMLR